MQSLRTRLAEQKEEILEYTQMYGRLKALDKYNVKDYGCFSRWLEEVTHDPEFGFDCTIRRYGHMSVLDELLERFLHKVAKLEAEIKVRNERIKLLEWQLDQRREIQEEKILAIIQACET
ncbi:hypothetical protein ES708_19440 [subsurface metagenome]